MTQQTEAIPPVSPANWWNEWKKPDGAPCTKWEVLRAFAALRYRNKRMSKLFSIEGWLQ